MEQSVFILTVFREQGFFGRVAGGGARCWGLYHQKESITVLKVQFLFLSGLSYAGNSNKRSY